MASERSEALEKMGADAPRGSSGFKRGAVSKNAVAVVETWWEEDLWSHSPTGVSAVRMDQDGDRSQGARRGKRSSTITTTSLGATPSQRTLRGRTAPMCPCL